MDLRCPVELLSCELVRDDHHNTRAYLCLNNLSHARVATIDALVDWLNADGQCVAQTSVRLTDINAAARAPFAATVSLSGKFDPCAVSLFFARIAFESGSADWTGTRRRLVDVPKIPAPDGRDLNRLAAAGPDAVNYPLRTPQMWVCVCGRANPSRRKHCLRCGRERDHVLVHCTVAALVSTASPHPRAAQVDMPLMQKSAPPPDPGEEARARLKSQCHRQLNRLIRRTITLLCFAVLAVLAAWAISDLPAPAKNQPIPPLRITAQP